MIMELGYDVNTAHRFGRTPCFMAAENGNLAVLRCLVKKFGADINKATNDGFTPLMVASCKKHADVVRWLVKKGANTQASMRLEGIDGLITAADFLTIVKASAEQTAYLEAKTHCSNPGCSVAGIKRCPACKHERYCGEPCQYAHWKAHKGECKQWSVELAVAGTGAKSNN
jgi:hypothetical protein